MALADSIRALRDRALSELRDAHDYYHDTRIAWVVVQDHVAAGKVFANRNDVTGTVRTATELAAKVPGYVAEQLAQATFQQFLAIFENFFFDLLRLWLRAFPQSLGAKQVDVKTILDLPDKDAILHDVIVREVTGVTYDRPAEWFNYLNRKVSIGCPSPDEIERLTEAKATRDVLAHNRGVANKTYVFKAGKLARYADGERIDIPEAYHREVWALLCKIVADVADAVLAKVPAEA